MTAYPYAVALVLPVALAEDGDRLSWALGRAPDPATGARTFVAALSADGSEPATHLGCNAQAAGAAFVAMLTAAGQGNLPDIDWPAYGLTAERVGEVMAAMEAEITASSARAWEPLLDRLGLQAARSEDDEA